MPIARIGKCKANFSKSLTATIKSETSKFITAIVCGFTSNNHQSKYIA